MSAARPKIAAYPFTTLVPNLGVIEDEKYKRMVIADIPGLIEGAHEGRVSGHPVPQACGTQPASLVHIPGLPRTSTATTPSTGYEMLNQELHEYNPEIADKPQIKVVNKIDTLTDEELADIKAKLESSGERIFFISALSGVTGWKSFLMKCGGSLRS